MSLQQIKTEVLTYLFEEYLKDENTIFDIGPIVSKHGKDPHELGRHMLEQGLIKNQQYLPRTFVCGISMEGIRDVNPEYINNLVDKIISTLIQLKGWQSIMEILDFEPKSFQRVFELAKLLESQSVIDAQYRHNDVIIKLTLGGQELYESNGPAFF